MPCIDFCIGGPHGHGSDVRKRADLMLRLSGCVLNHQVSACPLHLQYNRALCNSASIFSKMLLPDLANAEKISSLHNVSIRKKRGKDTS